MLSLLYTFPALNLLSLGYLLVASSQVAQTGRFRPGFPGLGFLAGFGKFAAATWLFILPIRFTYDLWRDAEFIELGSQRAEQLKALLIALVTLTVIHLAWAVMRGGLLRNYFWPAPLRFLSTLADPPSAKSDFPKISSLSREVVRSLKTGFFGFLGGGIWLSSRIGLMLISSEFSNQGLSAAGALAGGGLLGIAVLILPFLQTGAAISGRFRDHFDILGLRRQFQLVPLAFCLALVFTLVLALPALSVED